MASVAAVKLARFDATETQQVTKVYV